jgi:AraC-like DNA-binding protein
MPPPLFTFRQLPTIAEMLATRDVAMADILRDTGLPSDATQEITAPLPKVQRFVALVAERLGAPLFGLDLAERIPEGAFGVTEFVVRSSPTLQHGLAALCELAPLVNPAIDLRYIADSLGCEVRFAYAGERDALGVILNEYTVAYVARQFRVVLQQSLPLVRAWFSHMRAAHQDELERRLGCPVELEAPDCGFAVASDVISQPVPTANPALHAFLMTQARAQLALVGKQDVIAQVTRAIEARMSEAELSAATVAQALGLSQRTFQRQLTDAGTTYRTLVAQIRRRRHAELVRAGLDDADIAPRLGFASAKSMRRALDDDQGADTDA